MSTEPLDVQMRQRLKQYKDDTPGKGVTLTDTCFYLTQEQWDSLADVMKDNPYTHHAINTINTVMGGIRVTRVSKEAHSGFYANGVRIGAPFMGGFRVDSKRLNERSENQSMWHKLTAQDKEELERFQLAMRDETHAADDLPPIPDCYRPILAYNQLRQMGALDGENVNIWNVPPEVIDHLSDIWYCSLITVRKIHEAQHQEEQAKRSSKRPRKKDETSRVSPVYSVNPNGGGNA